MDFAAAGAAARLRARPRERNGFGSLAELRAATGQEAHGIEVDYDIFENLRAPDADKPHAVYHARELNFKLKPAARR